MFFFCKRLLKRYIYMIIYRINPGFWQTTHPPLPKAGLMVSARVRVNLNPMEGWMNSLPETGIDPKTLAKSPFDQKISR